MHVPAGQRVAGGRDRTGQRLALTGGHLDDVAGEHPQRAQQLDVEGTECGGPFRRLPGDGEELADVARVGEVVEQQQLGGLLQLLVVEVAGLSANFSDEATSVIDCALTFSVLAPSSRQKPWLMRPGPESLDLEAVLDVAFEL